MLLTVLTLLTAGAVELPFWRVKEKYVERVRNGEVVVSVATREVDHAKRRLMISGGGHVKASPERTFAFARRLDCVAKTSGFVTRAELKGNRLGVTFKALGKSADFDVVVTTDEARRRIEFKIVGGPLDQLKASLTIDALGPKAASPAQSEVGIDGHYDYEGRLKGALVGFGLEGVFKHMAESLRRAVERAPARPDADGQDSSGCGKLRA